MNIGRASHGREALTTEAFADALAGAVRERAVSLTWLRERLIASGNPISLATLSSWRSGGRRPEGAASLAAVQEIERLLGLPSETLSGLLTAARKPGRPVRVNARVDSEESTRALLRTLGELGCTERDFAALTSSHVMIDVDAERCQHTFVSRFVLEAPRDGYHRLPFIVALPEMADPRRVRTEDPFPSIIGGRRVTSVVDDATGCYGVVIELDPPLARGEQAIVEITFIAPPGLLETHFDQIVPRRQHETVLWVRFHPDAVPARIECRHGFGEQQTVEPLDPRGESAHLALRDFGPGFAAIHWDW